MLFACNVPKFVFCMCAAVGSVFVFRSGSGLQIQSEVGAVACKVAKFALCMGAAMGMVLFFASSTSLIYACAVACMMPNVCFRYGRGLWAGFFFPETPATSFVDH